jgi:pre-rRNA-processing protein TSR1
MNDYQADWFLDEEGQFDMQAAQGKPSNNEDGEPLENDWENDNNDDNDELAEGLSVSESMWDGQISSQTLLNDKKLRREANDDKEFADEIDTPQDTSARIRLARYRALQSFRSSPWHPKENLPETYSQIFQFEDFLGTQKRF